jgi:type I restriction enzyme, R subunit
VVDRTRDAGASREKLDPILDVCVAAYLEQLDEDGQVDFKSKAKIFTRAYDFLGSILPYGNREWEKLSILLNLLIPKLPAPKEEDLSKGILESIGMDSYRIEHDKALAKVMLNLLKDDTQVYKQFVENEAFRRAVSDFVYSLTAA